MNFPNVPNGDNFTVYSENTTGRSDKPLPLKQRTSSSTNRRDFTPNTWISLLQLIKFREYVIPVDHFSIWRRHSAWAIEDGKDLKAYIGKRYASNMVFMSLLLSTEFGVLFNSSTIVSQVRDDLGEAHWWTMSFWAGLFIIISSLCTILSLISTFTFTAMISAVDEGNIHCILRSSIGQYTTELPGKLIVYSIYTFLISFMSFFFLLLPVGTFSIVLLVGTVVYFVHIVSTFSSFGRIIMHSGAMGKERIFSSEYEAMLVPHSLHYNLLSKAKCNLAHNTSIIRQYQQRQIDGFLLEEELYDHLSGSSKNKYKHNTRNSNRLRADSKVRFMDDDSSLIKSEKEVIGGRIEGLETIDRPNFRSLTPLSVLSSDSSIRPKIEPTITVNSNSNGELSSLAVPPKKFFGNPGRPSEISDVSIISSMQNVSHSRNVSQSSLEQWLQGNPSGQGGNDVKGHVAVGITTSSKANGEAKDSIANGLSYAPPPPTLSISTIPDHDTHSLLSTNEFENFAAEKRDSLEELLHTKRDVERGMTDDERFEFDYGNFGRDNSEDEKNTDELDKAGESESNNQSVENERTRLLR